MRNASTVTITSVLLLGLCTSAMSQPTVKSQDDIILRGEPRPKVLLVGSMHFAYYGYDAHKTSQENKIDFLSPKRQAEIDELADYIARFKPNKIVIEKKDSPTPVLDRYRRHLATNEPLIANEIDQIAFRLLEKFGLDTLYAGDASSMVSDLETHKDSAVFQPWLEELFADYDYQNDDLFSQRYFEWYEYRDAIASQLTILELFQVMNAEANIIGDHGVYLIGDFKLGEYRGADVLAINWYSRNLRIFRNIQRVVESPEDRILVLFGAGHLGILYQQFLSSPEFELVRFSDLEE